MFSSQCMLFEDELTWCTRLNIWDQRLYFEWHKHGNVRYHWDELLYGSLVQTLNEDDIFKC